MMSKLTLLCAAIGLALVPGAAFAGTLQLVIGGEAYDGPPMFEVSFNGEVLGQGTVNSAIDTPTEGRFADAAVKAPYLQTFTFTIPDGKFAADGEVRVRFLNEAYGGDGSNRDRNLYIASVAVNGRALPGPQVQTMAGTVLEPSAILGDYLVLPDGTADAVAVAPDEGWPVEGTAVASSAVPPAAPAPALIPAETEVAATPAPVAEPQPAPAPAVTAVVETPKVPAAEDTPAAKADVAVAAAPETPAPTATAVETKGVEGCALDQIYNVLGFNENSNDLTPKLTTRLDQILADIGNEECVVSVIGYSSTVGDYATNALFAVERAQNVLAYLKSNGLKMAKATATGAGETEQFGAEPRANQRVVITVSP